MAQRAIPPVTAPPEELSNLVELCRRLEGVVSRPTSELPLIQFPGHEGEEPQLLPLPRSAAVLLRNVLESLQRGEMVTAHQRELTTQEAADLLGMSRQQFVNLLKQDALPFHTVGSHRRVYVRDVLAYKARRSVRRRQALAELTAMSEEMGLYALDA